MSHLHPPKQARSRRTLDRLLRATLELIDERGVEATGVHDIVERAGSSVGSFYARFESKEDLLLYLEGQLWADAEARWASALDERDWAALSLDELAGAIVRVLLEAYRVDARQRRVLDARHGGPAPDGPAARFRARLRADLGALLLAHRDRITHDDPEAAVDFALGVLVGAIREARESPEPPPDERLTTELARMMRAYLGQSPDGGDATGGVEFFEIWE